MTPTKFGSVLDCDKHFQDKPGVQIAKWGSAYCSPCKMLDNVIAGMINAGTVNGSVKIDTDVSPHVLSELQLTAVPYSRVYLDGQFKGSFNGVFNQKALDDLLNPPAVEAPAAE